MVVEQELNLDDGATKLREWLNTQPHLPQNIDTFLLKRYVHSCRGDLEYAKKIFIHGFTLRLNNPQIFSDRDPNSERIQSILKSIDMVPLSQVEGCEDKFIFYRLADCDPDKFNFNDVLKTFFIVSDTRLMQNDVTLNNGGDIPIFDMTGFTLRHLTKVVLSSLRVYMKYTQEAHPVRLKSIHVINCTPFLDRVMTVIKPFMKKEVARMLHFHLPNSETMFKHFPKEALPEEYGGMQCIEKLKQDNLKKIEINRFRLIDDTKWKIDESKMNSNLINNNNEVYGQLRKLEID